MSISHLHVILSFRFFILVSFRLLVITGRNWSFRLSFQHPRKAIFGVKRITMVLFAQTNTRSQWWRISRQNTFHLVGREESGGENERMKMRRWNFTRRGVAPQLIGLRKEWRRFVGEYHGLQLTVGFVNEVLTIRGRIIWSAHTMLWLRARCTNRLLWYRMGEFEKEHASMTCLLY